MLCRILIFVDHVLYGLYNILKDPCGLMWFCGPLKYMQATAMAICSSSSHPPRPTSCRTRYTILYYTLLYCTRLDYTLLWCTILYYTIVHATLLYYTILYHTVVSASHSHRSSPMTTLFQCRTGNHLLILY